jgi:hypothetical protein
MAPLSNMRAIIRHGRTNARLRAIGGCAGKLQADARAHVALPHPEFGTMAAIAGRGDSRLSSGERLLRSGAPTASQHPRAQTRTQ